MATVADPRSAVRGAEESRWMTTAAALSLLAVPLAIVFALPWQLVHDVPLLHYVLFLMDHGRAPYRDIIELNMPGSYMMEWGVLHLYGGGAHALLAWDITTGLAGILTCWWVAGRGRRAAGLAAGALIYLLHLSNGPADLAQRDWVVALLLLVAVGFFCEESRRDQPVWAAGAMCALALGASIKPHMVVLAILFLAMVCLRKRSWKRTSQIISWSAVGAVPAIVMVVAFLWRWHAAEAFLDLLRNLLPWYASLERAGLGRLLLKALPGFFLPAAAVAAFLFWKDGSVRLWERRLVLAGVGSGIFMYLVQRKGWPYHKYTSEVFLLLWITLELTDAFRAGKLQRRLAMATTVFLVGAALPLLLYRAKTYVYPVGSVTHMESDLESLGGAALSGDVQCLDMTYGGCINALYRLHLVQATGFIYDFYLFPQKGNAVTSRYQERFLHEMQSRPPRVIVFCSHTWPGDTYSYEQVKRWPVFEQWLESRYRLDREYVSDFHRNGYRIYTLQESTHP